MSAPVWAMRLRWIMRGGADARLQDITGPHAVSAQTQRDALLALADLADDDGVLHHAVCVTPESLGRQIKASEKTARRALRALEDADLIASEGREGSKRSFRLVVEHIEEVTEAPHRWGDRAPTRQPVSWKDPSHEVTPPMRLPLPPGYPSHEVTPPMVTKDPSHQVTPPLPPGDPPPSHQVTPHPYRIVKGSDLDREDRTNHVEAPPRRRVDGGDPVEVEFEERSPPTAPSGAGQLVLVADPQKPRKPTRAPRPQAPRQKVPQAPETSAPARYAAAYAAGIEAEGGHPCSPPPIVGRDSQKAVLIDMARTHARGDDGAPLTGEALLDWFHRTAAEFRRAPVDDFTVRTGYRPAQCLAWLNAGRPQPRPLARATHTPQQRPEQGPLYQQQTW